MIVGLFFAIGLEAQVEKTIENTAGQLNKLLSAAELSTITDLTITGTMDALDFKSLRDDMPALSKLDISGVTILEYWGPEGPRNESITYDKNTLPWNSFCTDTEVPEGKISLTSITLPANITGIGGFAFSNCTGLTSIDIPSLVTFVGASSFAGCTHLGTILLPTALTDIHPHAFEGCTGLTAVAMPSVATIGEYAFKDCTGLTAITLPASLKSISTGAFNGCINLRSITMESLLPLMIYEPGNIFAGVDKNTCTLKVPYGTRDRYASAIEWKDFSSITENVQGFLLSTNLLNFEVTGGSNTTASINANTEWTAVSDQSWLTVNPSSGNNSQTLTVAVQANETGGARTGMITFSTAGLPSQTIRVKQDSPMKTVDITPGGLSAALTEEEKATISYLTITGRMHARDFWTMRYEMPMLSKLDLSAVSIDAYKETDPHCRIDVTYPANTLPGITPYCPTYTLPPLDSLVLPNTLTATGWYALANSRFTSIVIPPSVTTIGETAFAGCNQLTSITIPNSVTSLGDGIFSDCSSLTTIDLPASMRSIPAEAFLNCKALKTFDISSSIKIIGGRAFSGCTGIKTIDIPSSVANIGEGAFSGCSALTKITIPPSVTSIEIAVFSDCYALTSVEIPASVTIIKNDAFKNCTALTSIILPLSIQDLQPAAFNGCTALQSITILRPTPPSLFEINFSGVDKSTCILYVPYGSANLYASATGWKDFAHIVEMAQFSLSTNAVTMESGQQSATVALTTAEDWTATSDQSWLTISPPSGSGSAAITLTAQANPTVDHRTASITFSTLGNTSPGIIVRQQGTPLTVGLTAGNLSSEFMDTELKNVNYLTLTGTMDARDFKFIRDELPELIALDLTGVTIVAYSGPGGTFIQGYQYPEDVVNENYPANGLPAMAFQNMRPDFTTVRLPASLTSIGIGAFSYCTGITDINIPPSVTSIGERAFSVCESLQNIELPPGLTTIKDGLFYSCMSITSLDIPSSVTSIGEYAFSVCQSLTSLDIPSSVTSIGEHAFETCAELKSVTLPASLDSIKEWTFSSTGLTSIRIPASVKFIGTRSFFACFQLLDFYSYPPTPPDLTMSPEVFYYLDQTKCTLHVPNGTKALYAAADQWKDFQNIVEMGSLSLEATEVTVDAAENSQATVKLHSTLAWTATSDSEWLTIDPASGTGGLELTLTAQANPQDTARIAIVTLTAQDMIPVTLTVTQRGMAVGVAEMVNTASLRFHPNPFTSKLAIEIENPSLKEVTVEIFSISGQKIKTLARAQKGVKISLVWKGDDEQGKKVPTGMYLVKMDGRTMKVVKEE